MTGKGQQAQSPISGLMLSNVACVRGGRMLFTGVSFTLGAGDALVLAGPNGVGKSSLLRLIAGLLPAYAGQISRTGKLALADEHMALDARLPLTKALHYWATLDGSDAEGVRAALANFSLSHLADVPVRMLSTGQRRRATLARIALSKADIWLLDEPGNGLDTASLAQLNHAMAQHRAAGGIVIAASHQTLDLPGAAALTLEAAE
jgi:heme exporter protein A